MGDREPPLPRPLQQRRRGRSRRRRWSSWAQGARFRLGEFSPQTSPSKKAREKRVAGAGRGCLKLPKPSGASLRARRWAGSEARRTGDCSALPAGATSGFRELDAALAEEHSVDPSIRFIRGASVTQLAAPGNPALTRKGGLEPGYFTLWRGCDSSARSGLFVVGARKRNQAPSGA